MPPELGFSMPVEYRAIVHHEEGSLWVEVTEMPGCFASGETMDELIEALTEAMSLYMTSSGVNVKFSNLRLVLIEHPDRLISIDHLDEYKILVGTAA
jgi:predicted RNase H-like HicB family nuclease